MQCTTARACALECDVHHLALAGCALLALDVLERQRHLRLLPRLRSDSNDNNRMMCNCWSAPATDCHKTTTSINPWTSHDVRWQPNSGTTATRAPTRQQHKPPSHSPPVPC